MSDEDFNDTFRQVFSLRLDDPIRIDAVLDNGKHVQMSLSVQAHERIKRALATPPAGAILAILLDQNAFFELHVKMQLLAKALGWQLPQADT